jgi:hypothetical protein
MSTEKVCVDPRDSLNTEKHYDHTRYPSMTVYRVHRVLTLFAD